MPRKNADLLDSIADKVLIGDDHWPWTGTKDSSGYGRVLMSDGHTYAAHRAIYELVVGPIPDGLDLDHLCRVRHCCRPDHMEPVTRGENLRRGYLYRPLKTLCVNGHPWVPENVRVRISQGSLKKECMVCVRVQTAAAKQRMRERRRLAS